MAMASVTPSLRQFGACLRCVRQPACGSLALNGSPSRLLSTTAAAHEEVRTDATASTPPPPPTVPPKSSEKPEFMKKWGNLDPSRVEDKRTERRLIRREGVQPIGSRRRRAALRRSVLRGAEEVPFEQLPFQCFQEARKFLLEDRQEKLKQIETQKLRLKNLLAQDPAISGGETAKAVRIGSMRRELNSLIIEADINDPIVKKKFEDGQGMFSIVCNWRRLSYVF
jgi:large subunit ribosomal protein L35